MTTAPAKPPSVRDLIRVAQMEIREGGLAPVKMSELLITLTSLLSIVLEEIRESEMAYNNVLLTQLNGEGAANRATLRAKTTPEYARAREAKDTEKVLLELIRSLKAVIRSAQEEMRLAR